MILCTNHGCQTTAGCKCNRGLACARAMSSKRLTSVSGVQIPSSHGEELRVVLAATADPRDATIAALQAEVARLTHMLKVRDRQAMNSRKFWVRAAKAALAGDPRELRNRVELAEAPPVDVVLSRPALGGSDAPTPTSGRGT